MNGRSGDGVRALLLAVVVSIAGLAAGVALTLGAIAGLRAVAGDVGLAALLVASLLLTQGVAFGGVALAYLRIRDLPLEFVPVALPSWGDLAWVGGGYVLALAGAFAGMLAVVLTGAPAASNQVGEVALRNPELLLLLIPASFVLIGPGEELLFRGIVQGTLREVFSPAPAIGLASAIFASVHFVALSGGTGGRLVTIAILFFPSVVFGVAYERTDNLAVPALIHGAYNATLFTLLYVSLRFADTVPA